MNEIDLVRFQGRTGFFCSDQVESTTSTPGQKRIADHTFCKKVEDTNDKLK